MKKEIENLIVELETFRYMIVCEQLEKYEVEGVNNIFNSKIVENINNTISSLTYLLDKLKGAKIWT